MAHHQVPPSPGNEAQPGGESSHGSGGQDGYSSGTFYAPGWSQEQLAGLAPKEPKPRGRGTRWAGLLAVVVILVGVAIWFTLNPGVLLKVTGATKPLPPDVEEPRSANVRQLSAGNCLGSIPQVGDEVTKVDVVPCADPHVGQVISAYVFSTDEWPGLDVARQKVTRSCSLSVTEEAGGYTLLALTPSEASWRQADRVGQCIAFSSEPVTESLT